MLFFIQSGSKSTSANYDPFGNIRSSSGILPDFQFSKQQLDSESNLYFLRARYYDPELGRFISRDPVKGPLTLPQSQNSYAYALNNPVNLSDPSGEFAAEIIEECIQIAGRITGYTMHGLNQAISRGGGKGVAPSAILDAVKNPIKIVEQAGGVVRYVGEKATVVLNEVGKIITTWGEPRNP